MSTSLETASSNNNNNNNNKPTPTQQSPQPNIVILDSQIMDSQDVQTAGLASLSNHNSMKFIREGAIQYHHTQNHIQSASIGQSPDNKVHVISNVTLVSKPPNQSSQIQYVDASKMATSKLITVPMKSNSGGTNKSLTFGQSYNVVQSSTPPSPSSSQSPSSNQISNTHLLQKMGVPRNVQVVTRIQASSSASGNNSNNIITYRATPDQQQQNAITFASATTNESNILIPGSTTGKSSVLVNNNNNNSKAMNYKTNSKQIGVKVVQNMSQNIHQLQQAQTSGKSVNIKGLHLNIGPNNNGKMTSGKNNSSKFVNTGTVSYQPFTPQYATPGGKLVRSNSGTNVIKTNKNQAIQSSLFNNMVITQNDVMAQAIQYASAGTSSPINSSPQKYNEQYFSYAASPSKTSTNVNSDANNADAALYHLNGQPMTDESSALILQGISQKMYNKINYPPGQASTPSHAVTLQQPQQNANSNSEQVTYIDNIPLPIKTERIAYPEHHPEEESVAVEMRPVPVDASKGKLNHILEAIKQDHTYFAAMPDEKSPGTEEPVQTSLPAPLNQANLNKLNSTSNLDYFNSNRQQEDDANSVISTGSRNRNNLDIDLGEETETAPEGEGEEDSVTRCICDFTHDDGYMISCDKCDVWQHVDCMGIDRQNIPAEYYCEECQPRSIDKNRARQIQMTKRKEQQLLFGVLPPLPPIEGIPSNFVVAPLPVPVPNPTVKPTPGQLKTNKKQPKTGVNKKKSEQVSTYGTGVPKKAKRDTPVNRLNGKRKELKKTQSTTSKKKLKNADLQNDEKALHVVRGWIENYERAMTNHYAPELRARVNAIGKQHQAHQMMSPVDEKLLSSLLVHNLSTKCVNIAMFGGQILISTSSIPEKMPIIEIRGRYMLAMQHKQLQTLYNPTIPNKDKMSNKYAGLFLFLYNIPAHHLEICVDTRTYGNDARYVRRSCKPNAEIQHNIEKGVVHLYIVAKTNIAGNTEITIQHDDQLVERSPEMLLSNTTPADYCACGVPRDCLYLQKYADLNKNPIMALPPPPTAPPKPPKAKKNNGLIDGEPKRQPKKRNSRSSTLEKRLRSISSSGGESTNELFLSPPPQANQQMNRLNLLIDNTTISREIQFNEMMSPPPPQIMQSPIHVPPPYASPVKFLKSRQNSITEDLELIHQQQQLHQQQIIEDVLKIQRVNTPLQSPIKQPEIITSTETMLSSPRIITNYNIIEPPPPPQQQQSQLQTQIQSVFHQSVLLSPKPMPVPEIVHSEPNLTPAPPPPQPPQILSPPVSVEPIVEPVLIVNKEVEVTPQIDEPLLPQPQPIVLQQPPQILVEQLQQPPVPVLVPDPVQPHFIESVDNVSVEIIAQTPEKILTTTPLTSPNSARKKSKDHGSSSTGGSSEKERVSKANSRKLTREERKMEAIVKAFEKMEQAQHRKQELKDQKTQGKRRSISSSNSLPSPDEGSGSNKKKISHAHKRKKKKTKVIVSHMITPNVLPKKKRPMSKKKSNLDIQHHIDMARPLPTLQPSENKAAELLLTFSQSTQYDNRNEHPASIIQHSNSVINGPSTTAIQHTSPSSLPLLSSACMLIEAAVGPLEQATNNNSEILQSFKMPQKAKTKKSIMNDWLHQAAENANLPQPPPSQPIVVQRSYAGEQDSGYISEADYMKYQKTDENKMCIVAKKVEEFIMQNSPQPDDPTFIKWEETKNIPVTQHLTNFNNTAESCVKKRWLRQAISEETTTSDELVTAASSPPPVNGFTTPLKKRRVVRENQRNLNLFFSEAIINNNIDDNSRTPSSVENSSVIVSPNTNFALNDVKLEVKEEEKEALDLSISTELLKKEKIEVPEIKVEEKIEIKIEEPEQSQYPRITRSKGSQKYIASPTDDLDTSDNMDKSSESSECSPKSNFETPEKSKMMEVDEEIAAIKEEEIAIQEEDEEKVEEEKDEKVEEEKDEKEEEEENKEVEKDDEDQQVPIVQNDDVPEPVNDECVEEAEEEEVIAEESVENGEILSQLMSKLDDEQVDEVVKEADQQIEQMDDKDDIENLQKVIATFHTENIMNLISRNRMKKKSMTSLSRENSDENLRASMKKAVKLNFDLSMEADMINVALKKPQTPPPNSGFEDEPQKIETIVDAVVPQNHYEDNLIESVPSTIHSNLNLNLTYPIMTASLPTSYQSIAPRNLLNTLTQDTPTAIKSYSMINNSNSFVSTSSFLKSNYLEGVYPSQSFSSISLLTTTASPTSLSSLNTPFLKSTLSEPLSTLGTPPLQALSTLGTMPLQPLSTLGTPSLPPLSTLGTLPLQPLSTLGTLSLQPLATLGTPPIQPLSTLGTPSLLPLSTLGTPTLQLSTTPITLSYPKIFTKTASSDPRLNPALTVPAPPAPPITPKRKLSINEYRKRKQQCETPTSSTPTTETTTANFEKLTESNLNNNNEESVTVILSATEKILSEPPTSVDEIENSLIEKNNNSELLSSAMDETENNVTFDETPAIADINNEEVLDTLQ